MSKIIAVLGATGAQGGALVKALLNDKDKEFKVRAVTRNPDSEKAKLLLSQGVEVVKADLDDVDSLVEAFKGCYGAFLLTNYWEHMNMDLEIQQHHNLGDAAARSNLKHIVLSTLEDTRKFIKKDGSFPILVEKHSAFVPHLDGKGEGEEYIKSKVPITSLLTSFYYENFIYFGMGPKKNESDPTAPYSITLPLGVKPFPMNAVDDIGKMAASAFKDPSTIGSTLAIASEHLPLSEVAAIFQKVLNVPVVYNAIEPATYASFGFPGADDLANMFKFFHDYHDYFAGIRSIEECKKRVPDLISFEEWVTENKQAFQV